MKHLPAPVVPPVELPATIPRKRRVARDGDAGTDTSFESLRAEGVRLAQALSGKGWTDYNLHDPGVTILEQLCYALTDLVYRADFSVADHLQARDADGIDYAGLSLYPPHEAFPCRATSVGDYRRVLLDQVPGLDDATLIPGPPSSAAGGDAGDRRGLYRLQLKLSQGVMPGEDTRIANARATYRARRNLCEDIDTQVSQIHEVLCDLQLDVELSGPRDAVDVLADIYARCARHVIQGLGFASLGEELARGLTLEQIYTGPLTDLGFATGADRRPGELLFVSDLTTLAKGVDGVHELRSLSIRRDGDDVHSSAMRWRGDSWALRLRVPGVTADVRSPQAVQALLDRRVTLRRRGSQLKVSPVELANRMADLSAASRTRRNGPTASESVPLPSGKYRDRQHYRSVQDGFPAVYGLGRRGLPPSATPQEKAQARQLQTYLLLFEQVMAHSAAQIEHLRDLFSGADPRGATYWWHMIDSSIVPGTNGLYLSSPDKPDDPARPPTPTEVRAQVQADVYESRDPRTDRKSRALDHLLALHGETCSQNSMRQFCDYLDPAELDATLLDNKAAFLKDILSLTRDRSAGFDYARPSWNVPGSGSGLQRRVSLLLGFRHVHSRSLTQPVKQQRLKLRASGQDREMGSVSSTARTHVVPPYLGQLTQEEMKTDLRKALPLDERQLGETVLRCGLYRERYRLSGPALDHAGSRPQAGSQAMLLGPDETGHWWPLGDFDSAGEAARAAESMRRFLMHLSHETEGLHIVEHVLLRAMGDSPEHANLAGLPADFHSLRLTAVLPTWTARCSQPNFQRFAEQTLQITCPAHVATRCLWLDFAAMESFERCFADWLAAKLDLCEAAASYDDEAKADPAAVKHLNHTACAVINCLRPVWPTQPDPTEAMPDA